MSNTLSVVLLSHDGFEISQSPQSLSASHGPTTGTGGCGQSGYRHVRALRGGSGVDLAGEDLGVVTGGGGGMMYGVVVLRWGST